MGAVTVFISLTLFWGLHTVRALDNGLARTPIMGYNTWNAFKFGINETLIKQTSDLLVSLGLQRAGYSYMSLDGAPTACKPYPALRSVFRQAACVALLRFPACPPSAHGSF